MEKSLNNQENKEDNMGLLGRGRGFLGLPKSYNSLITIVIFIWIMFGGVALYLFLIKQYFAGIIAIASGIMFTGFVSTLFSVFNKR